MLGNLYRMIRFGPALYRSARKVRIPRWRALWLVIFPVLVMACDIGGPPFKAALIEGGGGSDAAAEADPPVDAATDVIDANVGVARDSAPEAMGQDVAVDSAVEAPDPQRCNPNHESYYCGSQGSSCETGEICTLVGTGSRCTVNPAVCPCTQTSCDCVLAATNPCGQEGAPYNMVASCEVLNGEMIVTCSQ